MNGDVLGLYRDHFAGYRLGIGYLYINVFDSGFRHHSYVKWW